MIAQWQGEPIEDKSILVWTDQGLGDTIMLARYIPMIKARRIVVYVDAAAFRLLRYAFKWLGIEVLMKGWAFPRTDLHVPWMSLMKCFGLTDQAGIPRGDYLSAPAWAGTPLRPVSKVGVNWQGNKRFVRDFTRSMPIEHLDPLLQLGLVCQFVSLQKGNAYQQIGDRLILDCMDECTDLLDTASLINELDLVVTTDTVIPHIAGALGKPCYLLESYESEWRWGLGDVSPWYDSVQVFRQPKPGDWRGAVEKVRHALAQ